MNRFTENLKILKIASREPHNRKRAEAYYNQIAAEMDLKRDMAYQELNEEFLGPNPDDYSQIIETLEDHDLEEYNDRKQEVRWEIAWQIFDAVNEGQGLDTQFEIDLNELDVEEAQAICKQVIYDVAEKARNDADRHNLAQSRDHVLAVLCADGHFGAGNQGTLGAGEQVAGTPFTQISEDMSENNAYPAPKSMEGSKRHGGMKGLPTPNTSAMMNHSAMIPRRFSNLVLDMMQDEL